MGSNPYDDSRLQQRIKDYERRNGFRTGIFREAFDIAHSRTRLRVNFASSPPEIVVEGVFEPGKGDECLVYYRLLKERCYDWDGARTTSATRARTWRAGTKRSRIIWKKRSKRPAPEYKALAVQIFDPRERSLIEIANIALGKILYSDGPDPILNRSCFGVLRHEQLREWKHEGVELPLVLAVGSAAPRLVKQAKELHVVDLEREATISKSAAFHIARENTDLANLFWDFESADFKKRAAELSREELMAYEEQIKNLALEKKKRILCFAGDHGPLTTITKPPGPFLDSLAMSWVIRLSDEVFALAVTRCDFGAFNRHNDAVTMALNDLHDAKKTALVVAHKYLEGLPPEQLDLKETYVYVKEKILDPLAESFREKIAAVKSAMDRERERSGDGNASKSKGKEPASLKRKVSEYRSQLDAAELDPRVAKKLKSIDSRNVLGLPVPSDGPSGEEQVATAAAAASPAAADPEAPQVCLMSDDEVKAAAERQAIADKAFATFLSRKLAQEIPHFDSLSSREKDRLRERRAKKEMGDLEGYKIVKHFHHAEAMVCCGSCVRKEDVEDISKELSGKHSKHPLHTKYKCKTMQRRLAEILAKDAADLAAWEAENAASAADDAEAPDGSEQEQQTSEAAGDVESLDDGASWADSTSLADAGGFGYASSTAGEASSLADAESLAETAILRVAFDRAAADVTGTGDTDGCEFTDAGSETDDDFGAPSEKEGAGFDLEVPRIAGAEDVDRCDFTDAGSETDDEFGAPFDAGVPQTSEAPAAVLEESAIEASQGSDLPRRSRSARVAASAPKMATRSSSRLAAAPQKTPIASPAASSSGSRSGGPVGASSKPKLAQTILGQPASAAKVRKPRKSTSKPPKAPPKKKSKSGKPAPREKSFKAFEGYDKYSSPDITEEQALAVAKNNLWIRCARQLLDGQALPLVVTARQLEALAAREALATPHDPHSAALTRVIGKRVLQIKAQYGTVDREQKGKTPEQAAIAKADASASTSFAQSVPNRIRDYADVQLGIMSATMKRPQTTEERNRQPNPRGVELTCFYAAGSKPPAEDKNKWIRLERRELVDYKKLAM
ncbi:hypothetical protein DFJ74DRAFT_755773 [Hyaloraphidium curvatum]|nr:hypothetical protein DFJ74DRAFT_755773 [Hyaloraphidium curvatum]